MSVELAKPKTPFIPPLMPPVSGWPAYPWDRLVVGGSFHVPRKQPCELSSAILARSRGNPGEKYRCRLYDGGVRVWRIA